MPVQTLYVQFKRCWERPLWIDTLSLLYRGGDFVIQHSLSFLKETGPVETFTMAIIQGWSLLLSQTLGPSKAAESCIYRCTTATM